MRRRDGGGMGRGGATLTHTPSRTRTCIEPLSDLLVSVMLATIRLKSHEVEPARCQRRQALTSHHTDGAMGGAESAGKGLVVTGSQNRPSPSAGCKAEASHVPKARAE